MNLYLLKEVLKAALLKRLGVEEIAKRAFTEGYNMHGDDDFGRLVREVDTHDVNGDKLFVIGEVPQLREVVLHSRCWRSVDEAWANSDVQEMFE